MEDSEQTPEITGAEEQQSEEQILDDTSSLDNSTEESVETQEPEVKKPSRAQQRIQDLVKERNYYKSLAEQGKQAQSDTLEGVDDTGIDPVKFSQSVAEKAAKMAEERASNRVLAIEAERDFPELKESRVFQNLAAAYVSQGLNPYDAAIAANEDYQAEIKTQRQEVAKRAQADKTIRKATFNPSGVQTGKAQTEFSEADIASMSTHEYEQNKEKIFKQFGIR